MLLARSITDGSSLHYFWFSVSHAKYCSLVVRIFKNVLKDVSSSLLTMVIKDNLWFWEEITGGADLWRLRHKDNIYSCSVLWKEIQRKVINALLSRVWKNCKGQKSSRKNEALVTKVCEISIHAWQWWKPPALSFSNWGARINKEHGELRKSLEQWQILKYRQYTKAWVWLRLKSITKCYYNMDKNLFLHIAGKNMSCHGHLGNYSISTD